MSPDGYRLADFLVRTQGVVLTAFGMLLTTVLLVPYRAGQRWSWYAAFILPRLGDQRAPHVRGAA